MRLDIAPGRRWLDDYGDEVASDWAVVDLDDPIAGSHAYYNPVWMEGVGYLHHFDHGTLALAWKARYLRELIEVVTEA